MARPVLVTLGVWIGSVAASFILIAIGLAIAGKSLGDRAGYSLIGVIAADALVYLGGVLVVFFAVRRAAPQGPAKWIVGAAYGAFALVNWIVFSFASALAFNR